MLKVSLQLFYDACVWSPLHCCLPYLFLYQLVPPGLCLVGAPFFVSLGSCLLVADFKPGDVVDYLELETFVQTHAQQFGLLA